MSLYRSALARAPPRVILPSSIRAYSSAPTNPPTRPKGTQDSPPLPPSGSKFSADPAVGGVNSALVWVGALTVAAGGAYWYSTTSKGAAEKDEAAIRAREMKAKADVKANEVKVRRRLSFILQYYPLLVVSVLIIPLGRSSREI
jgi:hypothetical protein